MQFLPLSLGTMMQHSLPHGLLQLGIVAQVIEDDASQPSSFLRDGLRAVLQLPVMSPYIPTCSSYPLIAKHVLVHACL